MPKKKNFLGGMQNYDPKSGEYEPNLVNSKGEQATPQNTPNKKFGAFSKKTKTEQTRDKIGKMYQEAYGDHYENVKSDFEFMNIDFDDMSDEQIDEYIDNLNPQADYEQYKQEMDITDKPKVMNYKQLGDHLNEDDGAEEEQEDAKDFVDNANLDENKGNNKVGETNQKNSVDRGSFLSELTSAYQEDSVEYGLETADSKEEAIKIAVEDYRERLKHQQNGDMQKAFKKYGDDTHVADITGKIWDAEHKNTPQQNSKQLKDELNPQLTSDDILKKMSNYRKEEEEKEKELIHKWAVEKSISNEEFLKQSQQLHKTTQDNVQNLYNELLKTLKKE